LTNQTRHFMSPSALAISPEANYYYNSTTNK
jgi:hypothetical protein